MKCRPRGIIFEYFRFGIDTMPKWFSDRVRSGAILIREFKPILSGPLDVKDGTHYAAMITRADGIQIFASHGDHVVMLPDDEIRVFEPDYFSRLFCKIEEE